MKLKIEDKVFNDNWEMLLKLFHKIKRNDEGAKEKYESLIDLAKTIVLTPRQIEGISARCNYQIRLIGNPSEEPFSNSEKKENRNTYQLSNVESNGKS